MSTRDIIRQQVEELLRDIAAVADDDDLTQQARGDLQRLHLAISFELGKFNQKDTADHTDGGPTRDDLEGVVRHGS
jgi:hypothetical protein